MKTEKRKFRVSVYLCYAYKVLDNIMIWSTNKNRYVEFHRSCQLSEHKVHSW